MPPSKSDCTGCKFIQRVDLGPPALPETHIYRCSFMDTFEMPIMFKATFNPKVHQLTKSARQVEGPFDDIDQRPHKYLTCRFREDANA